MTKCNLCWSGTPGYVIEFDSPDSCQAVQSALGVRQESHWIARGSTAIWLDARLVQSCADYWREHLDPHSWLFRSADRTTSGVEEPASAKTWSEVTAGLPRFWIDDIVSSGAIGMWFQPLVAVTDRVELIGYEMLARAEDAFGSPIPPQALFDAARNQDRLFVLDKECRVAAVRAAAAAGPDALIFINFVPTSIYNPAHCLRTTMQAARDEGVDMQRVVFEVVETDRVDEVSHLASIFDFYRRAGARCALDDCGAGFNSIETMLALRPDVVKLDRSIASGAAGDVRKRRAAADVVDAAKRIGAAALAEGIEREEDAACLRDMGYRWQQGYLYGKPAPTPGQPEIGWIGRRAKAA